MDRKKNGLVILALLAVIAIIAGISFLMPKTEQPHVINVTDPAGIITTMAPDTEPPAATPAADAAPDEDDNDVAFTESPAVQPRAWLLITVDDKTYAPYPLTKSGDYTINQKKKNATNVIHVTEDSIQMASSTCDNQLCVTEGVVTLDNKASRILGNYIICLPNGVTLELLNEEEYAALQQGQR